MTCSIWGVTQHHLSYFMYMCVNVRSRQRSTCSGWGGKRGATGWCHLLRRAVRWTHPSSDVVTHLRSPSLGLNVTEDCFCARHRLPVRTIHRFSSLYAFAPYSITNQVSAFTPSARLQVNFSTRNNSETSWHFTLTFQDISISYTYPIGHCCNNSRKVSSKISLEASLVK